MGGEIKNSSKSISAFEQGWEPGGCSMVFQILGDAKNQPKRWDSTISSPDSLPKSPKPYTAESRKRKFHLDLGFFALDKLLFQ